MVRTFSQFVSILALTAVGLTGCKKAQPVQARQDTGPISIQASPVKVRQIQRVVESVGTLFPYDEAIISAELDGRVDRVAVDLGDRVKEGEVLVHIMEEEQRYMVSQTEAQMRQALERLGLKNETDRVADIRETPDVRRARADLQEAEMRFKRLRDLVDQKIGAQADLDQAQARYQAAEAAYDSMLNQTRNLIQDVERSRAVLDLQRKKLRDATVRAPFAAQIKERQVTVGQFVRPNTPLMTLVKTDPIRLRIEVPERMAPWIKVGQIADVTLEAYADRKFQGKIWRISPTVDQSKRTFIVEALIENRNDGLKAGSYAKARITTDKFDRINVIPAQAVNYVFGANKVYLVKSDTIEARDVKLGDRVEQEVEVLEGVVQGDQVATSELTRLDTGAKVRVVAESGPPEKSAE